MKDLMTEIRKKTITNLRYNILIYDDSEYNLNLYKHFINDYSCIDNTGKQSEMFVGNDNILLNNNIIYCHDYTEINKIIETQDIYMLIMDVVIPNYKFDSKSDENKNEYGGIDLYKKLRDKYNKLEIHFITALDKNFILNYKLKHTNGVTRPMIFERTTQSIFEMLTHIKNYIKYHLDKYLLDNLLKYLDVFYAIQPISACLTDKNLNVLETNDTFVDFHNSTKNLKTILLTNYTQEEVDEHIKYLNKYKKLVLPNFGVIINLSEMNIYLCAFINEDSEYKNKYSELKSKFKTILNSVPDLIWVKDLNGNYTYTNEAMNDDLLLTKFYAEPLNKTIEYFQNFHISQTEINLSNKIDKDTIASELTQHTNFYNSKTNNMYSIINAPLFDISKHLAGTVGIARNTTAINEKDSVLKSILNCGEDITIVSVDNQHKLTYWNKNLFKLSIIDVNRINKHDNTNINLYTILKHDIRAKFIDFIDSNKIFINFIHYDEDKVYNILISKLIDENDNVTGYTLFIIDKSKEHKISSSFDSVKEILQQQIENDKNLVIIFDKHKQSFLVNSNLKKIIYNRLKLRNIDFNASYKQYINIMLTACSNVYVNDKDIINDIRSTKFNLLEITQPVTLHLKRKKEYVDENDKSNVFYKIEASTYTINNKIEYYVLVLTNITDVKENEQNILKQLNKQRKILNKMKDLSND